MLSDSEIICQAVESYSCRVASELLGFSSMPTQTLIRYAIRNVFQKYGKALEVMTDSSGNIRSDLLFEAFKTELRERGGYTVFGIKFTSADVEEISKIYQELQEKNV